MTQRSIIAIDLPKIDTVGLRLIGELGGVAHITGEVYESNVLPGYIAVETEFGSIYLDDEIEVTIDSDDDAPLGFETGSSALDQSLTDAVNLALSTYTVSLATDLNERSDTRFDVMDMQLESDFETKVRADARQIVLNRLEDITAVAAEDGLRPYAVAANVLDFVFWDPDPSMFIGVGELSPARGRLHDFFLNNDYRYLDMSPVLTDDGRVLAE